MSINAKNDHSSFTSIISLKHKNQTGLYSSPSPTFLKLSVKIKLFFISPKL